MIKIKFFIYLVLFLIMNIGSAFGTELSSTSYYITSDVFSICGDGITNSASNKTNLLSSGEVCVGSNKSASYYIEGGFLNTLSYDSNQLRIVLTVSPSTILANNTSQAEIKATIYDKYDNIATYATYPVYFTNFNNTNNKYGYFVGSTSVTPVNGVTTIYFHSSSNVSTNIVIYAYNPSSKYLDDSEKIYITHGTAEKILLSSSVTNYKVGSSVTNIIFTAKIVDHYDNLVNTGSYTLHFTNNGAGHFVDGTVIIVTNGIGVINFMPGNVKGKDIISVSGASLRPDSLSLVCESGVANNILLVASSSNLILNNGSRIIVRGLLVDDYGNIDVTATNTVFFKVRLKNLVISSQIVKATNGEADFIYSENKYGGKVDIVGSNTKFGTNKISVYVNINGKIGGTVYNYYDYNYNIYIAAGSFNGNCRIDFTPVTNINLNYSEMKSDMLSGSAYRISAYNINNDSIEGKKSITEFSIPPVYKIYYSSISNYNYETLWFYDENSKGCVPVNDVNNNVNKVINYGIEKFGTYFLGKQVEGVGNRMYNLYPNPFNPLDGNLKIFFNMNVEDKIRIDVYDISGRHIRNLVDNENCIANSYVVEWDGRDSSGKLVGSGIYIIFLHGEKIGNFSKRVAVLKIEK